MLLAVFTPAALVKAHPSSRKRISAHSVTAGQCDCTCLEALLEMLAERNTVAVDERSDSPLSPAFFNEELLLTTLTTPLFCIETVSDAITSEVALSREIVFVTPPQARSLRRSKRCRSTWFTVAPTAAAAQKQVPSNC